MGGEKKSLVMSELGCADGCGRQMGRGEWRVLQLKVINCIVMAASRFFFILVLMIFL